MLEGGVRLAKVAHISATPDGVNLPTARRFIYVRPGFKWAVAHYLWSADR